MDDFNEKSPLQQEVEKSFNNLNKDTKNEAGFLSIDFEKELGKQNKFLWECLRLNIEDKPEKPPILISINGKRFSTEGNISMITGKAKSKKTFLNTAIAAAAISDKEILGFSNNGIKQKVLYFDTEQSIYDSWIVLDRIHKLSGTSNTEDLFYFPIKTSSPGDRLDIIDKIVNNEDFKDCNFIIIDGIRDLLFDFNSPEESIKLVTKLMKWTENLNKHILTVLHQNKGNENARGHLGSELTNKCETTVSVKKEESDSYISTVKAEYTRGKEFEDFSFRINDEGIPVKTSKPEKDSIAKVSPEKFDTKMHQKVLTEVFKNNQPFSSGDFISILRIKWSENNVEFGNSKCRDFLSFYLSEEFLINKGSDKKFRLYPSDKYLVNGKIDFSVL